MNFIPLRGPADQYWFCKPQTLIGLPLIPEKDILGTELVMSLEEFTPLRFCMCIQACIHVYKNLYFLDLCVLVCIYIHTLYMYVHKITLFGELFYCHNHTGLKFGVYNLFPNTIFQPFSSVYFF